MKNKKMYMLLVLVLLVLTLVGCADKKSYSDVVSVIYYTNTGSSQIVASTIDTNFDLKKDDKVPQPEDPVAFGAAFLGWYKDINYTTKWDFDNDIIKGSMVLYARWQLSDFTITYNFDANGGQLIDAPVNSYSALTTAILPKADRIGSRFIGWILTPVSEYKAGDSIITSTRGLAQNLDLYALFEYREYIIRFNTLDASQNPRTLTLKYLSNINFAALPNTSEKRFVGWFSKDGTVTGDWGIELVNGEKYSIVGDITAFAKWESI